MMGIKRVFKFRADEGTELEEKKVPKNVEGDFTRNGAGAPTTMVPHPQPSVR